MTIRYTWGETIKWGGDYHHLAVQKVGADICGFIHGSGVVLADDRLHGMALGGDLERGATALFGVFLDTYPITNEATHSDALNLAWSWMGCEGVEESKRLALLSAAIARYEEGK